jgi:hypothetical protein
MAMTYRALIGATAFFLSTAVCADESCRNDPERVGMCIKAYGTATTGASRQVFFTKNNPDRGYTLWGMPKGLDDIFDEHLQNRVSGDFEFCPLKSGTLHTGDIEYRTCIVSVRNYVIEFYGQKDRPCQKGACVIE